MKSRFFINHLRNEAWLPSSGKEKPPDQAAFVRDCNCLIGYCVTVKMALLVAVPPGVVIATWPVFAPVGT